MCDKIETDKNNALKRLLTCILLRRLQNKYACRFVKHFIIGDSRYPRVHIVNV